MSGTSDLFRFGKTGSGAAVPEPEPEPELEIEFGTDVEKVDVRLGVMETELMSFERDCIGSFQWRSLNCIESVLRSYEREFRWEKRRTE